VAGASGDDGEVDPQALPKEIARRAAQISALRASYRVPSCGLLLAWAAD
jgi:hypothetical protein